jgi:hypothetical protein
MEESVVSILSINQVFLSEESVENDRFQSQL